MFFFLGGGGRVHVNLQEIQPSCGISFQQAVGASDTFLPLWRVFGPRSSKFTAVCSAGHRTCCMRFKGFPFLVCINLGVPSPFFPGILLFRKPSKAQGNSRFLKRTMVEKNWESTPRIKGARRKASVVGVHHETKHHRAFALLLVLRPLVA